jgi:hypothetical protein
MKWVYLVGAVSGVSGVSGVAVGVRGHGGGESRIESGSEAIGCEWG